MLRPKRKDLLSSATTLRMDSLSDDHVLLVLCNRLIKKSQVNYYPRSLQSAVLASPPARNHMKHLRR